MFGLLRISIHIRFPTHCHLLLLHRGGQAGDPAGVTLEGTAEHELFGHVESAIGM